MKETTVYLSHVRKDDELANLLSKRLLEDGFKVWHDLEIPAGSKWEDALKKQLFESDFVVVLLTANAFKSNWVRKEFELAFFNSKFKNRVYPVFIGAKDESFESLPWIYSKIDSLRIDKTDDVNKQVQAIAKAFSKYAKEALSAS